MNFVHDIFTMQIFLILIKLNISALLWRYIALYSPCPSQYTIRSLIQKVLWHHLPGSNLAHREKKIPVQLSVPWWPTVLVCLGLNSFLEHRAFSIVFGKSVLHPTQTLAEAGATLSASCLLLSVASFLGEEDWLKMEVERTQDIFRSGHYLPRSDRCLYRLAYTVHSQSICWMKRWMLSFIKNKSLPQDPQSFSGSYHVSQHWHYPQHVGFIECWEMDIIFPAWNTQWEFKEEI